MRDKIVFISAKQKAGKSTLADELLRTFKTAGFATAGVYKFAGEIYKQQDIILNRMETLTGKPRLNKDGDLLQILGKYGRTKFGLNVWTEITRKEVLKDINLVEPRVKLEDTLPPRRLALIDDGRFRNEFNIFPEAFRIRIECPEDVRKARPGYWRDNVNDESEIDLDGYAAEGRFDMYLYTDPAHENYCTADVAANLIYAQLLKGNWQNKRREYHD